MENVDIHQNFEGSEPELKRTKKNVIFTEMNVELSTFSGLFRFDFEDSSSSEIFLNSAPRSVFSAMCS